MRTLAIAYTYGWLNMLKKSLIMKRIMKGQVPPPISLLASPDVELQAE